MKKKVLVHLMSGAQRLHEREFKDDHDFIVWLGSLAEMILERDIGIVPLHNPFAFYKLECIAGLEFPDETVYIPEQKLPLGFHLKHDRGSKAK